MTSENTPEPSQQPDRRRLIRTEGDGKAVYRAARKYNARARITVAPDAKTPAELFQHPSLELTVHPDGRWTLERRPPGVRVDPVLLASGHIDDAEDSR